MGLSSSLRSFGTFVGVLAVASAIAATPVQAQRITESKMAAAPALPFTAPQQGVERKEPMMAGILSFFVSGLGSFYAGNNTHGIIHLGIEVGSFVLMGAAVSDCVDDIYTTAASSCDSAAGMYLLGLAVLGINGIWSIFTAMSDANAFNARGAGTKQNTGRVVGELYVAPDVKSVHSGVGMQVMKLTF